MTSKLVVTLWVYTSYDTYAHLSPSPTMRWRHGITMIQLTIGTTGNENFLALISGRLIKGDCLDDGVKRDVKRYTAVIPS